MRIMFGHAWAYVSEVAARRLYQEAIPGRHFLDIHSFIHSFIHSVVCLTTGP
jgi:hypothetical protein